MKAGPAWEPYGGPRDTSCHLSMPVLEGNCGSLGVIPPFGSPPAQASSFSSKETTGKVTGWEFPLNTLLHFKSSSWHLWDEQLNLCEFNQQNYPRQPLSSQRDFIET